MISKRIERSTIILITQEINYNYYNVLFQEQTWTDKLKPANPIGFVISSVVSIAAILVFFFAIPCPDNPA
jgi:hypothetical protein